MKTPDGARWFKKILRATGLTAGSVRMADTRLLSGQGLVYTRIVLENETSAANVARIGILQPDGLFIFHYFASFAADVPQVLAEIELPLDTYEQLVIDWTGTTTADLLSAYLVGYYYPLPVV